MAAGGHQPMKQGLSETKRHPASLQRSASSGHNHPHNSNSLPGETCFNNWTDESKGRKKSKGNPQREREQSLLVESPQHEKKKQHTPSSFPRTKMTRNTPKSERVALESLRQHMTFSDAEDELVSKDSEKNNERQVSHVKDNHRSGVIHSKTGSGGAAVGDGERHGNRNNMNYTNQAYGREESTRHAPPAKVGEAGTGSHQDLLDILREKQQQLEDLRVQQEELSQKYKETSQKLVQSKAKDNEAKTTLAAVAANQQLLQSRFPALQALQSALKAVAREGSQDGDGEDSGANRQLESNILGCAGSNDDSKAHEVTRTAKAGAHAFHRGHNQLRDERSKKSQLDILLSEIERISGQSEDHITDSGKLDVTQASNQPPSASEVSSTSQQQATQPAASRLPTNPSLQTRPNTSAPRPQPTVLPSNLPGKSGHEQAAESLGPSVQQQQVDKLRCLTEVREQLDNLRDLAQYYQDRKSEMEATAEREDTQSTPDSSGQDDSTEVHADKLDQLERRRAQLQRLRDEREIFSKILNKLDVLETKKPEAQSGQEQLMDGEGSRDVRKPGLNQTANVAVVTFASNDELYGKIRRQRILHEELQSQKRELENVVRKTDRRRHYSGNEDIHSDTASRSTDGFSFPASADATMATWGGSTVDNVEGLKDDGHATSDSTQGDPDNSGGDPDKSGGDPGNSDVRRQPRKYDSSAYSRHSSHEQESASMLEDSSSQSVESHQRDKHQEAGPLSQWFCAIEDRISSLTKAVGTYLNQSEMGGRQWGTGAAASGPGHAMCEQILQLQNQSMMLTCHQLIQTLARQQAEIKRLQQQVQQLQLQVNLCNMTPGGLLGNSSTNIPACDTVLRDSFVTSGHNFPRETDRRPADGAIGHLGAAPAHGSGSVSLHRQDIRPAGFVSNLKSQSGQDFQTNSSTLSQDIRPAGFVSNLKSQSGQAFKTKCSILPQDIGHRVNILQLDSKSRRQESSAGGDPQTRSSKKRRDRKKAASSSSLISSRDKKRSTHSATLHDTICTEVASLIRQNEGRPYFLLELFRSMQQIDSNRMRQQSLNVLQRLLQPGSKLEMAANPTVIQEELTTTVINGLGRPTPGVPFHFPELEDNHVFSLPEESRDVDGSPILQGQDGMMAAGRPDAEGVPADGVDRDDDESLEDPGQSPSGCSILASTCVDGSESGRVIDRGQGTVLQVSMLDKSGLSHLKAPAATFSGRQMPTSSGEGQQEVLESKSLTEANVKQPHQAANGSDTDSGLQQLIITGQYERLPECPALLDSTVDSHTLRCRYQEEQRTLIGLDTILASLGGMEELAGDEASVLDPDIFLS